MAFKIITCPWCGKEARITYEENRVYQMKCYSCHNTMLHVDHSFDSAVEFFEHQANLLQAEQAGRMVVLPCKVGDIALVKDRAGVLREMRLGAPDIRFVCTDEDNFCGATCNRKPDGFCAYRIRNDGTDIGKTVFLTREEAEAALAQEGGTDEDSGSL